MARARARGEVSGIFVFPRLADNEPGLDDRLLLLDRAIGLLEAQKRLHVVNTRDDGTEVLADSADTEMFDNDEEEKDLSSQVSKGENGLGRTRSW